MIGKIWGGGEGHNTCTYKCIVLIMLRLFQSVKPLLPVREWNRPFSKNFAMRVNIACSRNFSYPTINKACAETDARAGRCASTTCSYTCVNPP